jgi:mannose-6-phosphate isomerase-like protein (cupin superfamily)
MPHPGQLLEDPDTHAVARFVATADSSEGEAVVLELDAPPGWTAGPLHEHPEQVERIEVLSGRLLARIEQDAGLCTRGEDLTLAPGTPHTVENPGPAPARLRVEFSPALRTDCLFEQLYGGGDRARPPLRVPAGLRAWFESRGFAAEIRYVWPRRALAVGLCAVAAAATLPAWRRSASAS